MTVTPKVGRSTPARKVGVCEAGAAVCADIVAATNAANASASISFRIAPILHPSESAIHGKAQRLRADATVFLNALEAVAPLERQQRAERSRRLDAGADTWIRPERRGPSRVVYQRRVAETVDAPA